MKKNQKKNKEKKKKITGIITTILAFTVLAASFVFFTYINIKHHNDAQEDSKTRQNTEIKEREGIPPEQVCMVNDAYKGTKQIPVPVGDNIYYGCCQNCVVKLQINEDLRFAQDPVTGKMVDKSKAYIVLKSGTEREVLYFASKESFVQYSEADL